MSFIVTYNNDSNWWWWSAILTAFSSTTSSVPSGCQATRTVPRRSLSSAVQLSSSPSSSSLLTYSELSITTPQRNWPFLVIDTASSSNSPHNVIFDDIELKFLSAIPVQCAIPTPHVNKPWCISVRPMLLIRRAVLPDRKGNKSRAIAGRTARCRCKIRLVLLLPIIV